MKVNDFKLLSTLPEEYDYQIYDQQTRLLIVGKFEKHMIAFFLIDGNLEVINLKELLENTSFENKNEAK